MLRLLFCLAGFPVSNYEKEARTPVSEDCKNYASNKVIGKNTYEAIQSGLIMGHASMIDSMVEKIILEIDIEPKIILTGGLSKVVQPILNVNVEYIENLTLVGLEEIFKLNN